LAIYLQLHGEQHPHTALGYHNVAFCLDIQGKHREALPLFQRALAIFRKVHGEQHPGTATTWNNLASCLAHLGRRAEALRRLPPLFAPSSLSREQQVLRDQLVRRHRAAQTELERLAAAESSRQVLPL